jgi:hypothetical protein
MKKRIHVTASVIKEAIERKEENISICHRCIITIALQRAFKTKDVITFITHTFVNAQRIKLPEVAINITCKTSHFWEQVKPFSFTVTV